MSEHPVRSRGRGLLLSSVLAVALVFALSALVLRASPQGGAVADVALALVLAGGLHVLAAFLLDMTFGRRT